jgi:ornithine--oxo-acid transaminase
MSFSRNLIHLEKKFLAGTYKSLDLVINKGKNVHLFDVNKNRYLDFLSGFSAVNQGHLHPEIVKEAKKQLNKVTVTSRSFHTDKLSEWSEYICKYFNYSKALPMNSGAEAVETAIKLARRFGYEKKNINENESKIITFENNFHGRTIGVLSGSNNESYKKNFGPYSDGFVLCPYNNLDSVRSIAYNNPNVCAILIEPIQGEGGVIVPEDGYLYELSKICKEKNILLIADEIQTGLGRTGKLICSEYDRVKPDVLILGKSLAGGIVPMSCILANNNLMNLFDQGSHGSTFGGNPFACAVSIKSLEVIEKEGMIENSYDMGYHFRQNIIKNELIKDVRGKGLLNGVEFDEDKLKKNNLTTFDICEKLMTNGLLAKNASKNTIRFSPPLIINKKQMNEGLEIINKTFNELC